MYPGCWHFDNGATSKIDDVLIEHSVFPHTGQLKLGQVPNLILKRCWVPVSSY